jgi:phosphinothricin acetyltransferase
MDADAARQPVASSPRGRGAVRVRTAEAADAEAIRVIYNHEVQRSTATFDLVPRSADEQRAWLANRSGAFSVLVAVAERPAGDDDVLGFASVSPYKERAAYRTTVEDSVYVRADVQGRGIGKTLLTALLDNAAAGGFHAVMARIEASRTASRALHEACGFTLVGIEREVGRKFNRWLDIALMQCLLQDRTRR